MTNDYNSEDAEYFNKEQESQQDQVVAQAVEAAAKGENIEQLLELMMASASGEQKEKIKKKFAAALKKRGLRAPKGDGADVPSRSTLARLRNALAISAQQAFERVVKLARARPDIATLVKQEGQVLASNGVMVEKIKIVSEADLGALAPTAVGKSQARGDAGRGTT